MIPKKVIFIACAIIAVTLAFVFYYSEINEFNFSETMALAQVIFTILAFGAVLYTLHYASVQFTKATAKPELKLFFNETRTSESTIVISQDKPPHKRITYPLKLSILNTGNAITDLFQIDFEIPEIFNPRIPEVISGTVENSVKSGTPKTVSFINKKVYVCFVNRPREICSLELLIQANLFNEYPNPLIIPYKIYGDWAEPQKSELKVIINKP